MLRLHISIFAEPAYKDTCKLNFKKKINKIHSIDRSESLATTTDHQRLQLQRLSVALHCHQNPRKQNVNCTTQ